jgi:hypothetical protein
MMRYDVPSGKAPAGGQTGRSAAVDPGADRDLTRYLCAAAYLDQEYARTLIREVSSEPHRAVAPAPGCDIPVVLRHAHAASGRRLGRDSCLALFLVLGVFFFFKSGTAPFALVPLIAAWLLLLGFDLDTRYGPRMRALREADFSPEKAPEASNEDAAKRISQAGEYADGNITVYSGYSPFVGFGVERDSWAFSLDVTKAGHSGEQPKDFDVAGLYEYVAKRVASLELPELTVEERVFADGEAIIHDDRLLASPLGRPVARVPRELLDDLKREPREHLRPYLAIHSTSWRGDLVVSFFVRFERSQSSLIVEGVHTILCPLQERYRLIDTLDLSPGLGELFKLAASAAARTPFALIGAPWWVASEAVSSLVLSWRLRRQDTRITTLYRFDYGARISVRQQASDDKYQRYFQKQDAAMVIKVAERRVLDALVEFAEERGIETGDLVQRQEVIVNNGIIASGGASVAGASVASGDGAMVSVSIAKVGTLSFDKAS